MSDQGPLEAGQIFAGDYQIERPLAQGGMGVLYLAKQLSTGELRALKLLHNRLLRDPRTVERFLQEARISSHIRSTHVVQVIQSGVEDSVPWISMELLHGQDLRATLEAQGPMKLEEVGVLFEQVGHALAQAHAAGIVHRDLKPDNLFLCKPLGPGLPFTAKVLDFGVAKFTIEQLDKATQAVGTPLWMAPEQLGASRAITPATDVWPLGLIAFTCLTGRSYWRAAAMSSPGLMDLLTEVAQSEHPRASERAAEMGIGRLIPLGFDAWFAACVQSDSNARYTDAAAAVEAFRQLVRGNQTPGLGDAATLGASTVPAFPLPPAMSQPSVTGRSALVSRPTPSPATTPAPWLGGTPATPATPGTLTPASPGSASPGPPARSNAPWIAALCVVGVVTSLWVISRARKGSDDGNPEPATHAEWTQTQSPPQPVTPPPKPALPAVLPPTTDSNCLSAGCPDPLSQRCEPTLGACQPSPLGGATATFTFTSRTTRTIPTMLKAAPTDEPELRMAGMLYQFYGEEAGFAVLFKGALHVGEYPLINNPHRVREGATVVATLTRDLATIWPDGNFGTYYARGGTIVLDQVLADGSFAGHLDVQLARILDEDANPWESRFAPGFVGLQARFRLRAPAAD